MKISQQNAALWMAVSLATALTACGGGGGTTTTPPPTTAYILTVNTFNPTTGVALTVAPPDNNGAANGSASFTRSYNSGTAVTVTAPVTSGTHTFTSWAGCTSVKTNACSITMNANATITATYTFPTIAVTPNTAIIGTQVQFNAALPIRSDRCSQMVCRRTCGQSHDPGTISASGLYNTPYPAPQPSRLPRPARRTQPSPAARSSFSRRPPHPPVPRSPSTPEPYPRHQSLHLRHECIPAFEFGSGIANISINRWGGDATSRYNYKLDVSNSASDWYFENGIGSTGLQDTGEFNQLVQSNQAIDAKTIGTVPVNGWVAKDGTSCSFPVAPTRIKSLSIHGRKCGNGLYPQGVNSCTNSSGCNITGVAATDTSTAVDSTWTQAWVSYLVGKLEQRPMVALPSTTSTMSRRGGTPFTAMYTRCLHLRRSHQ